MVNVVEVLAPQKILPDEKREPIGSELIMRKIRENFVWMRENGPQWPERTSMFSALRFDESIGEGVRNFSYEDLLPRLNLRSAPQLIDQMVKVLPSGRRLKILDVGCWTGDALAECADVERWRSRLQLSGITAQIPDSAMEKLSEKGIRILVADAHFLSGVFKGEEFDFVMSNGSLGCMTDQAGVLSEIWKVLSLGGIALMSGIYWPLDRVEQLEEVNSFLGKKGLSVVFDFKRGPSFTNGKTGERIAYRNVTMVKNRPVELALPLTPVGFRSCRTDCPETLVYDVKK